MNNPNGAGAEPPTDSDQFHDTEPRIVESLRNALPLIDEFADEWALQAGRHEGSTFDREIKKMKSRSTIDSVTLAALAALDHLHYFARYSADLGRVTAFASYTVIRSAMTSAWVAAWLIEDLDPTVRLTRTLSLSWQEATNMLTAANQVINAPLPVTPSERSEPRREETRKVAAAAQEIRQIALDDGDRLGIDHAEIKKKVQDEKIVKAGAALIDSKGDYSDIGVVNETLFVWRTLGASAHGQSWSAYQTAEFEAATHGPTGIIWRPSQDLMMVGFDLAWRTLVGARLRYRELAAPPTD